MNDLLQNYLGQRVITVNCFCEALAIEKRQVLKLKLNKIYTFNYTFSTFSTLTYHDYRLIGKYYQFISRVNHSLNLFT